MNLSIHRCEICSHIIADDDDFDKKKDDPNMCASCNDAFKYTDRGD
jgi:hypothetical protein